MPEPIYKGDFERLAYHYLYKAHNGYVFTPTLQGGLLVRKKDCIFSPFGIVCIPTRPLCEYNFTHAQLQFGIKKGWVKDA